MLKFEGLPKDIRDRFKEELQLRDPMYDKMVQMGNQRALWTLKPYVKYYIEDKGLFYTGRGNEQKIKRFLRKTGHSVKTIDRTSFPKTKGVLVSNILLRDYQEDIVDEVLKHRAGTIKLSTGFGKSIIALKLAEELQTRTLIVVNRSHLLKQFSADIEKHFGVLAGRIQGKEQFIMDITIASIDTLARILKDKERMKELRRQFGLVIFDECHTVITKKRIAVVQSFSPKYLFGMTATDERTDGQGDAIGFTFGDKVVERQLEVYSPKVHIHFYKGEIPVREYSDIISAQVEDQVRNKMIANIFEQHMRDGRKAMLLTKRIIHADMIENHLEDDWGEKLIHLRSSNKNKDIYNELRKNTVDYCGITGTFPLLGTGTDFPSLDTLVIAGDLKSSVLQKQAVGRVLRIFEGKTQPLIIDIVDKGNPILYRQALARKKVYKENGWEVEIKE